MGRSEVQAMREAVGRAIGSILQEHGGAAMPMVIREGIIRIGLADGLSAGVKVAKEIVAELDGDLV